MSERNLIAEMIEISQIQTTVSHQNIDDAGGISGIHESVTRSYHEVLMIRTLLELGVRHELILGFMDLMEGKLKING